MPESEKKHTLELKPYAKRQLIIIVDDEIIIAKLKAEAEAAEKGKPDDLIIIGEIALKILLGGIYEIAKIIINAIQSLQNEGINVLPIARSDATKLYLPPGHPRDNIIYVGHPTQWQIYYPIADFHRRIFEQKFTEAIKLLMGLGAIEIEVERIEGYSKDFASTLNIPFLTQAPFEAGLKATYHKNKKRQALFRATLTPREEIIIPDNLFWFKHEPAWQQIAEGRKKYGLKEFTLSLNYEDDFGINSGLLLKLSKVGLDIGGKFQDYKSTIWKITGKFN